MISSILAEFEKLREKDNSTKKHVTNLFSKLKNELNEFNSNLENSSNSMNDLSPDDVCQTELNKINSKIDEISLNKNFNKYTNDFYKHLSNFGKTLSNNFQNESIQQFKFYPCDKSLFFNIIAKDMYRKGNFKTADSLIKESGIEFDSSFRNIFNDLNKITFDLKNKKLESLLEWCIQQRDKLNELKSNLYFEVLKLKYVIIFNSQPVSECVDFSKKYFQEFIMESQYKEQIKKLMTMLIFKSNINNCPYTEFKEDQLWIKVQLLFISNCCTILNLPNESGFFLTLLAGMIGLPQIIKAEKIIKDKKDIINELPYEINLPNQLKFHSLFVCPVTKEISTPENPPMLLTCGHAVSQNALEKMQKGTGLSGNQIKCPTCPNTQNIKDSQKLYIF